MNRRSFLKSTLAAIGSVAVFQAQPLLEMVAPQPVINTEIAEKFAAMLLNRFKDPVITFGWRTKEEQLELMRKGLTGETKPLSYYAVP